MTLKTDLSNEINKILSYNMQITSTNKVPNKNDLAYAEAAFSLNTAVLFADVRGSSLLVNEHRRATAAKVLNAFLNCALRIVRLNSGEVRSFNGDSILAIFEPVPQCCMNATKAAMQLNWAIETLLRPAIRRQRYISRFDVGIGISSGNILCTKVGIRGEDNNDLIWPSTNTNLAAKLGNQAKNPVNIIICKDTWSKLPKEMVFNKRPIWKPLVYKFAGEEITVYGTNCKIPIT